MDPNTIGSIASQQATGISPTADIPNNVPGHVRRRHALEAAARAGDTQAQQRLKLLAEDAILQFFEYDHLPPSLQAVSIPFSVTAHLLVGSVPRNPERTVALRKLLEAKDAAVRAAIYF